VAIVFDADASSQTEAGGSSLTYSHTVGAGTNTIIVAQPCILDAIAGASSISTVTYNGTGMTVVPSSTLAYTLLGTYDITIAHYGLVAPATGAHDVVVTASENCDQISCGSHSWFGVHQSASFGTANTATGTDASPTADIASAVGEVVVASVSALEASEGSFASADTQRWLQGSPSGLTIQGGESQTGAASVTMNWTGAMGGGFEWGVSGVSLKSATVIPKFMAQYRQRWH